MHYRMSGTYTQGYDWQTALLSRLPIVETRVYKRSDRLTHPLFEACIEEEDGRKLTVFITHLAAAFSRGRGGDHIRRREVQEILRIMAPNRGTPHLLMGDFNAIAPGDPLKASMLMRYLLATDLRRRQNLHTTFGYPHMNFVVPGPLRFLNPLLRVIPSNNVLSALFDRAASLYAPRGSISMLLKAGYIDCFRCANPKDLGFTCPAASLAGRIDYIFASPELAERLTTCFVVTGGNGLRGDEASDHLPVFAEFGERAEVVKGPAHELFIHRPVDLIDNV
jgi:endonuclease/exonuclease/phosphatase family metal-dependent hydrolase